MAFKTNTRNIWNVTDTVGVGREVTIDLKRTPWAIYAFQIRHLITFSVAAGTTATMKAWGPEMSVKYIRLQGSRPGGSDVIKHLTGNQLARLNVIDSAMKYVDRLGPANAAFTWGPGVYNVGVSLRLCMVPPRVNNEFANQCLLPGPAYSNLALYLFLEDFAQLFSAGAANATFVSHNLCIDQIDVPTVDVSKSKFSQFQETYQRDSITSANTGYDIRPPVGNYFRQICTEIYRQTDNVHNDFLTTDFELRENVSTVRSEIWNSLRSKNFHDYNLEGGPLGSAALNGFTSLDFCEQGNEASLLDVSDFGYKGRDLKIVHDIPVAPGVTNYIDTISRIIIPRINV